jgi:acetyl-CoA C-acetyltransferase
MSEKDYSRIPVIIGVGQAIERETSVDAVEMAVRAARAAFDDAPGFAEQIQRLSMVAVSFSPSSAAPATEAAQRLGLRNLHAEVTTPGGNTPQWLVTRAAAEIAAGQLETTLILGGEATRSVRAGDPGAGHFAAPIEQRDGEAADPVVGVDLRPAPAEGQAKLYEPAEIYPMLESARAHAAGRSNAEQRAFLAPLLASFSEIAANNPFAWFRQKRSPEEIANPATDNRLTAEPYTKRMNAFPFVDLGSAVLVTTLERARAAGLEDHCVFPWSGATNSEPAPAARPHPGDSPAARAAAQAAFSAAGIGIDDIGHLDIYSCFPVAVEAAAEGLGIALDDPRGLTVTGGLPFFGGPGNNYSGHAIATLVEGLRESDAPGLVSANGGYLSKHSIGVYGTRPPADGFKAAKTSKQQAQIDAAALPVSLDGRGSATVDASTVVYGRKGEVNRAPIFARLTNGERVVVDADPNLLSDLAGVSLVGQRVSIEGADRRYRT